MGIANQQKGRRTQTKTVRRKKTESGPLKNQPGWAKKRSWKLIPKGGEKQNQSSPRGTPSGNTKKKTEKKNTQKIQSKTEAEKRQPRAQPRYVEGGKPRAKNIPTLLDRRGRNKLRLLIRERKNLWELRTAVACRQTTVEGAPKSLGNKGLGPWP